MIAPSIGLGQSKAPAPLPPAAQEALDKGLIATKVPDYLLAIRFFEEARTLAPEAPIIYLNLGLAESRIPGRELRAIAWFGAYLAAFPAAPNAAAVREQIGVLDVRNQSNLSRLIKSMQDAVGQVAEFKELNLHEVASLWAKARDFKTALKLANLITNTGMEKDFALSDIAKAQADAGDTVAALKTAALIEDAGVKSRAQSAFAEAKMKAKVATVFDWLFLLDDDSGFCSLNKGPFLDLAGHLRSLPSLPASTRWSGYVQSLPSDSPVRIFLALQETADKIVTAQNVIHHMLKGEPAW